jgi:hypothetical protein
MAKAVSPTYDVELAMRLVDQGVPLDVVASALGEPLAELARTLKQTVTLTPEDQQLAAGMRQLAWKAHGEAMWLMDNGSPDQKMVILRVVLGKTAGLIGQETSSSFEETKESVERIWADMRAVRSADVVTDLPVPESDTKDAEAPPPARGTFDPDEEPPDDEDPL